MKHEHKVWWYGFISGLVFWLLIILIAKNI